MKKIMLSMLTVVILLLAIPAGFAQLTEEEVTRTIRENLDKIDLSKAPGTLKFLLGKPRMNVELTLNSGKVLTYGFRINKEKITDFAPGGVEKPAYIVKLNEATLNKLINADDVGGKAAELYETGEIIIEPVKIIAKIKFGLAKFFMGLFS